MIKHEYCRNSVAAKLFGVRGTSGCVLREIPRKFHYCAIIRTTNSITIQKYDVML